MDVLVSASAADDRALIARIAQGDQAALERLYAAYRVRLRIYIARRLMANSERADEVMQDVFLGIWQRAAAYRGEASPAAWIFSIAHHHIAKAQRHLMRHAEGYSVSLASSPDDERAEALYGAVPSHENVIIERLAMQEALSRLSPKHREVLDLVFYHGFTLDEIAHILNIPVGTVKSRMSYARQALLHELTVAEKEELPSHE